MRNIIVFPAFLCVALAGCGGQASGPQQQSAAQTVAEPSSPLTPEDRRDQITAIDAARGDGTGMPADWYGAAPYDLARRAAETRTRSAQAAKPATPVTVVPSGGTAALDLLGSDDTVTTGV